MVILRARTAHLLAIFLGTYGCAQAGDTITLEKLAKDLRVDARLPPVMVKGKPFRVVFVFSNSKNAKHACKYVPVRTARGKEYLPYSLEFKNLATRKTTSSRRPSMRFFEAPGDHVFRKEKKGKSLLPGGQVQCSVDAQNAFASLSPGRYEVKVIVWLPPGVPISSGAGVVVVKSQAEDIKRLVSQLNGKKSTESAKARDALLRKPLSELVAATPELLKRLKVVDPVTDDAAVVLSLFGPDCGKALPAILEALKREKKDAERRWSFVGLIGILGVSGKKALPTVRILAKGDPSPKVRESAKRVIKDIDVTDAKAKQVLALLKLRKYGDRAQRRAVEGAARWVEEHEGFSVKLIQELMRLQIDSGIQKDLVDPDMILFFDSSPWVARIALVVVEKQIEGSDKKRRMKSLEILCDLAAGPTYTFPAELAFERLLASDKPETRKLIASKLGSLPRAKRWTWVLPKLKELAEKDKDASVRKAAQAALKAFKGRKAKSPK